MEGETPISRGSGREQSVIAVSDVVGTPILCDTKHPSFGVLSCLGYSIQIDI